MRKIKNRNGGCKRNPLLMSIFMVISLVSCMGLPILYFNSAAHANCYPDLPPPTLVYTGSEDYVAGGIPCTRYKLEVANSTDYPAELFTLGGYTCGLNTNASRTWVDIYDNNNNYIYGFCALDSPNWLKSLWFGLPRGTPPPPSVYIKMTDKSCTITYTSNSVSTSSWLGISRIAAGGYYTVVLLSDGTLWAWGYNGNGQLGDGTAVDAHSPEQIGSDQNWAAIAAGWQHTVALKSDGSLWAWGSNYYGQSGNGTTYSSVVPIQIGIDRNWVAIAAGAYHTVALKSDGTLWAWGLNDKGQLGDGTAVDAHSPEQIGSDQNWAAIAAGWQHTVALKSDNTLWAWGRNDYGQLGDGTAVDAHSPEQIGSDQNWAAISVATYFSAALKSDGTRWAWGLNGYGEFGNGGNYGSFTPVQIGTDHWAAIAAGGLEYTVAIKSDGSLWAWGSNQYGNLGDGTTTSRLSPVQIGTDQDWVTIAASAHTVALKSGGSLWAWGDNSNGQVGDGTTTNRLSPVEIFFKNTITTTAGPGGTITPGTGQWNHGATNVTFTIAPNQGYAVADVKVNGVSKGPITSWTIDAVKSDYTIEATFNATVNYTITTTVRGGGSISPSDYVEVPSGGSQAFTFTPNPGGYYVQSVFVDGIEQLPTPTSGYNFTNVTSDRSIEVVFAAGTPGLLAPTLVAPSNGATCVALTNPTPALSWNPSYGAGSYRLQVSNDNFSSLAVDQTIGVTSYALTTGLLNATAYQWRVMAVGSTQSPWSAVYTFNTEPLHGCLFTVVRGTTDPPDADNDGIDDATEALLGSDPNKKTLFIRPVSVDSAGNRSYWAEFISLFGFPASNPYSIVNKPGFAYIPPLAAKGIEVCVIGAPGHTYDPFNHFDYDPAGIYGYNPENPPVDILEITYKPNNFYAYSTTSGHTFYSQTLATWTWDTKGFTPNSTMSYGYFKPEIYGAPLYYYFNDGAYNTITPGQGPVMSPCTGTWPNTNCGVSSPMAYGKPNSVEFNIITFNNNSKQANFRSINTVGARGKEYSYDDVRRRTTIHEIGHALLGGSNDDHCADPDCIMYSGVSNWEWNCSPYGCFGSSTGNCFHKSGGSYDIAQKIHNTRQPPAAPILSSPANTTATAIPMPVTFNWSLTTPNISTFTIEVSNDPSFCVTTPAVSCAKGIVTITKTVGGTSATLSSTDGLSANTTYYWHVKASNPYGTATSSNWTFKTSR